MRIESITFKREENSPEEKGLLVVKTLGKEGQVPVSPTCIVIDEDCKEVRNIHGMKYNGRVALDYDTSLQDMSITKNGVSGDVMSEVQFRIL